MAPPTSTILLLLLTLISTLQLATSSLLPSSISSSYEQETFKDPLGRCTSIGITPLATLSNSTFTTHGNDCPTCDFRLAHVPSADYEEGDVLEIYMSRNDYPRNLFHDSELPLSGVSPSYAESNIVNPHCQYDFNYTKSMGSIPQVNHTYAYIDGAYGLMNEHQLSFGESTCDAKLGLNGVPVKFGGNALFDISMLSRVALMRCKTCVCAVETMGALAEQYGFYGGEITDWEVSPMTNKAEGGEALTCGDTKEAWVFNISPDDTGRSAVWAARRIPDGHISVIINTFSIGPLIRHDNKNYLFSKNIFTVAERIGSYNPSTDDTIDFTKVFRDEEGHTQFGHEFVDRRRWGLYNVIAPSQKFDPYNPLAQNGGNEYFPFSIKPDKLLSLEDVFRLHRDEFQRTPFAPGDAMISGPWGDPFRANIPRVSPYNATAGPYAASFERTVNQLWTSYTSVSQSRASLPDVIGGRVFYGAHAAMSTLFLPIYPSSNHIPSEIGTGTLHDADLGVMYWICCLVNNYMSRFYRILLPIVQDGVRVIEDNAIVNADKFELSIVNDQSRLTKAEVYERIKEHTSKSAKSAITLYTSLFTSLLTQNHDGFHLPPSASLHPLKLIYPSWYIDLMGAEGVKSSEFSSVHVNSTLDSEDLVKKGLPTLLPSSRFKEDADDEVPSTATVTTAPTNASASAKSVITSLFTLIIGILIGHYAPQYLRKEKDDGYGVGVVYESVKTSSDSNGYGTI